MNKDDIYYIAICIGVILAIWGLTQTVASSTPVEDRIEIMREHECNTGMMVYDQRCHEYYNTL